MHNLTKLYEAVRSAMLVRADEWSGKEIGAELSLKAGFTSPRTILLHIDRMLAMGYIVESCGTAPPARKMYESFENDPRWTRRYLPLRPVEAAPIRPPMSAQPVGAG